jgi:hypothetical protein
VTHLSDVQPVAFGDGKELCPFWLGHVKPDMATRLQRVYLRNIRSDVTETFPAVLRVDEELLGYRFELIIKEFGRGQSSAVKGA